MRRSRITFGESCGARKRGKFRKKSGPERDEQLAADILALLAAEPKMSGNQIASRLRRAPSTVRWYLHNVLGL